MSGNSKIKGKILVGKIRKTKIVSKISEKGFVCTLLYLLWHILKRFFCLLVYKGKKDDDIKAKEWIFEEWEKQWKPNPKAENDYFFKLFKYDYEDTCRKIKRNKRKNFRMKFISLLPLFILVFLFIIGILMYNRNMYVESTSLGEFFQKNNWSFPVFSTSLYTIVVILTAVIAKWIGVKKYQETWTRHSNHKYAIDIEMYKFIERVDEYSDSNRKKYFKKNIMRTWNENQYKFSANMKSEEGIGNIFKEISEGKREK